MDHPVVERLRVAGPSDPPSLADRLMALHDDAHDLRDGLHEVLGDLTIGGSSTNEIFESLVLANVLARSIDSTLHELICPDCIDEATAVPEEEWDRGWFDRQVAQGRKQESERALHPPNVGGTKVPEPDSDPEASA